MTNSASIVEGVVNLLKNDSRMNVSGKYIYWVFSDKKLEEVAHQIVSLILNKLPEKKLPTNREGNDFNSGVNYCLDEFRSILEGK